MDLRGAGFAASLTVGGITVPEQKIVAIEHGVLFTVNPQGVVRATRIDRIDSVGF